MVFDSQQAAFFEISITPGWNQIPTRQICPDRLRSDAFLAADSFPDMHAEKAIITEYDRMAHGLSIQNHRGLHG
jgi:hypothetical protein